MKTLEMHYPMIQILIKMDAGELLSKLTENGWGGGC